MIEHVRWLDRNLEERGGVREKLLLLMSSRPGPDLLLIANDRPSIDQTADCPTDRPIDTHNNNNALFYAGSLLFLYMPD